MPKSPSVESKEFMAAEDENPILENSHQEQNGEDKIEVEEEEEVDGGTEASDSFTEAITVDNGDDDDETEMITEERTKPEV